jgi:CheY-like chemotaxis protein
VRGELFEVDEARLHVLDELEAVGEKGSIRSMIRIAPVGGGAPIEAIGFMKSEEWLDPLHSSYLADYQDPRFIPPWERWGSASFLHEPEDGCLGLLEASRELLAGSCSPLGSGTEHNRASHVRAPFERLCSRGRSLECFRVVEWGECLSEGSLVLVVEDDALVLLATEDFLSEAGFCVETATTGAEAVAKLDDDVTRYFALVTDIRLGAGLNGWDVARRARELSQNMPVIYSSGDSAHEWKAQGVPESIMLSKPFAQAQLITALATLMNAAHVAGGNDPLKA